MTQPHIIIQQLSFNFTNEALLFDQLNLTISNRKIGLVGKNGSGKSTLLKLIANEIKPLSGSIQIKGKLFYVPQHPLISPEMTIADLLGFQDKLKALQRIEQGSIASEDFSILNEDWMVRDRLQKQLTLFLLDQHHYDQKLTSLSGGELTRLMLVKAFSSSADFLLFDEPTNHLDAKARELFCSAIQNWQGGIMIASHDRKLLNQMDEIIELTTRGLSRYSGNYAAYKEHKNNLLAAKMQQLSDAKKYLAKTRQSIQLTKEKHSKRQAQGRELRRSGSQPKVLLDAMADRSTASLGNMLTQHSRMLERAESKLHVAKEQIEVINIIEVDLPKTKVPNGKMVLEINKLSFSYNESLPPLIHHFDLIMQGPSRVALAGNNGSGKTTLIKLILGELKPKSGNIHLGVTSIRYLDQYASLLDPTLSIFENFLRLNQDANEHDAYQCLAQFLFKNTAAHKSVNNLSGGEKWRALLACVLMSQQPPQLLILDEPTNHLDINSIESIESALKNYQGALIVISHDQAFLESIEIERIIYAPFKNTDN